MQTIQMTFWKEDLNKKPWILSEVEAQMRQHVEDGIVVTDDESVYRLARNAQIAVLPVAEDMEQLDDFPGARHIIIGREHLEQAYVERIFQRFHKIPWNILETERTIVREQTVCDVDLLYEIYAEPSITAYTDALYEDPDEERAYALQYISNMYELHEHGIWIIEDKMKKGTIIGRAGLELRGGFDTPELGYVIRKEYQNQGYAFEVCKAILDYGKKELGMDEVRALMDERNAASIALCKKLGFSFQKKVQINGEEMLQYVINQGL